MSSPISFALLATEFVSFLQLFSCFIDQNNIIVTI